MRKYACMMIAILVFSGGEALALIDASFQPRMQLWDRYKAVIGCRVAERDEDKGTMTLEVTDVFNGKFEPKKVTVATTKELHDEVVFVKDGLPLVAFVGHKYKKRDATKILFYTGRGVWQRAEFSPESPGKWTWVEVLDSQEMGSLFGCWNGDTQRFYDMMKEMRADEEFFSADPFIQFGAEIVISKFDAPVLGVAIYDIDGDGKLDAYGCSTKGNRLFLQTKGLKFEDRTKAMGLDGVASPSVSFADVNANGRADLLAGGVIYSHGADGKFSKTTWLPAGANEAVKSSAFVEINGDGYPDVVISKVEGGLHAYLNPGHDGGAFRDATKELGLADEKCGAGQTGFFAPGDLNGDGRTDLFYAAEKIGGLLLIQNEKGAFVPGGLGLDLSTFEDQPAMTGAGCVAPLYHDDSMALVVPMDASFSLLAMDAGRLKDVVTDTNELENEPVENQLATLCDDLNVDGRVDIYTASRAGANVYHTNRGYGSYMTSTKRNVHAFPSPHAQGTWGMASGDVNGDGAPDVLLGLTNGQLVLMPNETLANRTKERPKFYEERLMKTRLVTVLLDGPIGVVGAKLRLIDDKGRVVALRQIGTNVNVGSCSPPMANLAVRGGGKCTLEVTWSDGAARKIPIDFGEKTSIRLHLKRKE